MKCSLGISNLLEEISSLSHSFVFLYFFALIAEEGFLISSCYSLELCIQMEFERNPVFLPRKFHGQRNLVGSWGCREVRHDVATKQQQHIHSNII